MTYSTFAIGMHDDPIAAFYAGDTYMPLNNTTADAEAALTAEELSILARMKSGQPITVLSPDDQLFADLDRLIIHEESQPSSPPAPDIPMHATSPSSAYLAERAKMLADKSAQIAADNERQRAERNRRRNRANRDPIRYATQKDEQKAAYAARILEEEGRSVRSYEHITGVKTKTEREAVRKERARADQSARRAAASQHQKDTDADRKWAERQRKKGMSENYIETGLFLRRAKRERKNNPLELWGAF